jgi:D-glycero-alpha-D-manno-heptose-7-phosphate kinase
MSAYENGVGQVTDALRALRELAEPMAEALRTADLARVGELLNENWRHQQALDTTMRTHEMALLERAVADAGALGGKAAGAGAGGCMFFLLGGDRARGEAAAREAGATVLPVQWCLEGARAW